MNTGNLAYPIGKFQKPENITNKNIQTWVDEIEAFPQQLYNVAADLSEEKLQWNYRPGSWTIQQVINHCTDSHINAFIRFKLALTEENPTIKPYDQDFWANLKEAKSAPVKYSLQILEGLHFRLAMLLRDLTETELERTFFHPEHKRTFTLKETIGIYAWHGKHHLAHITNLRERMEW